MFAGIGDDDGSTNNNDSKAKDTTPGDTKVPIDTPIITGDVEDDPLAELRNYATGRPAPNSRSSTPRLSSSATSVRKNTPPSSRSGRSSEEKPESDVRETGKSVPAPSASSAQQDGAAAVSGGSWWGGISSLASAAVKQAKDVVVEVQKNEEAVKWAEQVRGNYGALRGIGDDIRSRALPTFTNLLHTLAPPISQHERLQIHTTHDFVGYPSLDPLIYQTFSRVMSQVEGGDLLVIQRGSESTQRRPSEAGYAGSVVHHGWTDGPWWRTDDARRSLGAVDGLQAGTKLARVSAETYANDFFNARGGLEEVAKQATANLSESNPVRSSDIFLAIQAVSYTVQDDFFARGADPSEKNEGEQIVVDESKKPDESIAFAVYLHDPVHSITFAVLSQGFPHQWVQWMDAVAPASPDQEGAPGIAQLPEEIQDIIASGGVDPREWISEWMEEVLSLSVGVVAQRYVARRMGVGEGGIGRGKRREEIVESGGGEAARAI